MYPIINPPVGEKIFCMPPTPPEKTGSPIQPNNMYILTALIDIVKSKIIAYSIIKKVANENGIEPTFIEKGHMMHSMLTNKEI